MGYAPTKCPMCGEYYNWKEVDTKKEGFSVGKAVAGNLLFGPIGLLGGALGKSKVVYCCGKCGFQMTYDH